jgi:hypothetical protein
VDAQLRAGHPDVEGLCRALVDWSAELRLIEREGRVAQRLASIFLARDSDVCSPYIEAALDYMKAQLA